MRTQLDMIMGLTLDVVEMVIVAIFAALQWSSTIPLFPVYSRPYWFLFGLTVAYLIVLLIKFLRKWLGRKETVPDS